MKAGLASAQSKRHLKKLEAAMAVTSPEVKKALEVIFAADSDIYQTRGFQRRIGYGARPALVIIDLANAWTKPGYAFTCDDMDVIIPTNQALLKAARAKRIPIVYTTTAYQDPKGPRSDTGLWHLKIPAETLYENSEAAAIDERIAPEEGEMVICKKSA
ncbi:MAG: isochorismatase family protein, partial [Pseudomonadota bacterium]|nr:isochorismatase family protein [Pseudomonadota bacterium]